MEVCEAKTKPHVTPPEHAPWRTRIPNCASGPAPWLALDTRYFCRRDHRPLRRGFHSRGCFAVWSLVHGIGSAHTLVTGKSRNYTRKTSTSPLLYFSPLLSLRTLVVTKCVRVGGVPPYQAVLRDSSSVSCNLAQF